jgi:phosphoesterase RecJ-like protein
MTPIKAIEAAKLIKAQDKILIITHRSPDGDTLGGGFALYYALRDMGKRVRVTNSDPLPKRFSALYEEYRDTEFKPSFIISVDTADTKLFGEALQSYKNIVDLCIDHHHGNTCYAEFLMLNGGSAAACELMFDVISELGTPITPLIASCLYTGIVTDTGCFRYSGTTADTLRTAAQLIDLGADYASINRVQFEIKTRTRIKLEQYAVRNTEYYLDNRCAFSAITKAAADELGVSDEDYDGLAALTTQAENVEVGILVKEKEAGKFRISLRSSGRINVSAIGEMFDGGGHIQAAGCSIDGKLEEVRIKLLKAVADAMGVALFLV